MKVDGSYIDFLGTKFYYLNNLLHREDGPAVQAINGDKSYWIDGMLHREDGPAVEWSNGNKVWYIRGQILSEEEFNEKVKMIPIKKEFDDRIEYRLPNGKLHREGDLPAIEWRNGDKSYRIHGELHREDGPAIYSNGHKEWWVNGQLHREDGPAIEYSNGHHKEWCINGKRHRLEGPAIEYADGAKSWWLNGIPLSEEEFNEKVKMIPIKKEFDDRIEYHLPNGDLHREDGPAVEYSDGGKQWCINGKLHREDGPAVEWENGARWWYFHGKLHRDGDLPAVVLSPFNSFKKDATKFWYSHGKLHRKNGPAIEYSDGHKCHYLNGQYYSEQDYCKEIERESLSHILSNVKNDLNKSKSIKKSLFFSLAFLWIVSNSDKKLENRIEAHKEEEIESSKLLVGHKSNNQLY
jgi:hypothetical protein